jgi:hypothetical protein
MPKTIQVYKKLTCLKKQYLTCSIIDQLKIRSFYIKCKVTYFGFGGLEVACWPLVPKLSGSYLAEAVGFLRRKIPQHAFLRRRSKAVGPMP